MDVVLLDWCIILAIVCRIVIFGGQVDDLRDSGRSRFANVIANALGRLRIDIGSRSSKAAIPKARRRGRRRC